MRICHIASTYPRFPEDNAARFISSLAEAHARQGNDVHVLIPFHPQIRPLPGPVKVHTFRYIWPDSLSIMGYSGAMDSDRRLRGAAYALAPLYLASGVRKLAQLTSKYEFDIIHAHWIIPNGPIGALVAGSRKIPFFVSLHGSDAFVARSNPLLGRIARAAFKKARTVTACSPHLKESAVKLGAHPLHTHVVPYGVDAEIFEPKDRVNALEIRKSLDITNENVLVLSLGRLVKKKGIEYLIHAVPAVIEKHAEAVFVIAGSGPEKESLQRLVTALGIEANVRFTGNVPWKNVSQYLQASDIFVVPSITDDRGNLDGLPNTILEAMASGKPVVASRLAGIPLVIHDRQTGLMVEEKQSAALARSILTLIGDVELRQSLGQNARSLVEAELTWDDIASTISSYYTATN